MMKKTKTNLIKLIMACIMSFSTLHQANAQEFNHQGFPLTFTKLTIYHWDGTSAWIEDGRMVPKADNSNPPSGYVLEIKNGTQYDSAEIDMITYNSNGHAISEYDKKYNGSTWAYSNKDTFMYDANGLEISAIKYDYISGSWVNHRRYTFTNNADGTEKEHLEESWGGSGWSNADQYSYTYSTGLLKLITRQTWTSGAWATSYQYLPNYVSGVENYEIMQQKSGSNWVNAAKYEFISAPSGPAAPDSLTVVPVKKKLGDGRLKLSWKDHANNEDGFRIYRSTDGTTFTQSDSVGANITTFTDTTLEAATQYYYKVLAYNANGNSAYSNTVSSTTFAAIANNFTNPLAFGIFPNPAQGMIHIQYSGNTDEMVNLKIMDMHGRIMFSNNIKFATDHTLDLAPGYIPDGVYIIKAENSKGTYTQRLVIVN